MSIRIVSDSSCNIRHIKDHDYAAVPMIISAENWEFTDDDDLNVKEMIEYFAKYKEKSSTACPGPGNWLEAFGDADRVIVFALTSKLSGAYNSAVNAAEMYMEDHPDRKVVVFDTLTTGPAQQLLIEKTVELIDEGLSFKEVAKGVRAYQKRSHLAFLLADVKNFAANGRVNPALAKMVELLKIKIVGNAEDGTLIPTHKCRGEKKGLAQLWTNIKEMGYKGGKVDIRHTDNVMLARRLAALILEEFPEANVKIGENRGLCSYYAEPGSILVGFDED